MCIKLINPYNILGSYYYYHLCFSGDEIKAQKNQDAIRGTKPQCWQSRDSNPGSVDALPGSSLLGHELASRPMLKGGLILNTLL